MSSSVKKRLKVRFQLPHAHRVRQILEAHVASNEPHDYMNLVCVIRDAELPEADLVGLLQEATACISLLNQHFRLFVDALLALRWVDRSRDVVQLYQGFLVSLVSAHNVHAKFVLDRLVTLFTPSKWCVRADWRGLQGLIAGVTDPQWPDGKIVEEDRQICLNVHVVIKILLDVVPM